VPKSAEEDVLKKMSSPFVLKGEMADSGVKVVPGERAELMESCRGFEVGECAEDAIDGRWAEKLLSSLSCCSRTAWSEGSFIS